MSIWDFFKPHLSVRLVVIDDSVSLRICARHCDTLWHHNHYIDINKFDLTETKEILNCGLCPNCGIAMYLDYDDKYDKSICPSCLYTAWSDKQYDIDYYYDDDDYVY